MRVIIIEDEIRTARELESMLLHLDNSIRVEAILTSVAATISWFKNNPSPALIFSDIQLGDGLSFEIFREVKTEVPVIFCTAFDEYAIRAFESNSIDYLLKPVEEGALARSLEKYTRFKEHLIASASHLQNLTRVVNQMNPAYKQNMLVHYRDQIIPVKVSDIQFIHASGRSVQIYVANDRSYAVQYTIEQLELMLNPAQFFRANRQFIINRETVRNIEHYFNRKLYIIPRITPPEKIIIGKIKVPSFLKWIEQ